jgi:hypothetical protein
MHRNQACERAKADNGKPRRVEQYALELALSRDVALPSGGWNPHANLLTRRKNVAPEGKVPDMSRAAPITSGTGNALRKRKRL